MTILMSSNPKTQPNQVGSSESDSNSENDIKIDSNDVNAFFFMDSDEE
jgi:hypothetical protein